MRTLGYGREAVKVTGEAGVLVAANDRVPVRGFCKRAVAGENTLAAHRRDPGEIGVVVKPTRGRQNGQEHSTGKESTPRRSRLHAGARVRDPAGESQTTSHPPC